MDKYTNSKTKDVYIYKQAHAELGNVLWNQLIQIESECLLEY